MKCHHTHLPHDAVLSISIPPAHTYSTVLISLLVQERFCKILFENSTALSEKQSLEYAFWHCPD